jgi:hypothetical protein
MVLTYKTLPQLLQEALEIYLPHADLFLLIRRIAVDPVLCNRDENAPYARPLWSRCDERDDREKVQLRDRPLLNDSRREGPPEMSIRLKVFEGMDRPVGSDLSQQTGCAGNVDRRLLTFLISSD